jgi:formylglycine-generating enzyme required for sulfatase activity
MIGKYLSREQLIQTNMGTLDLVLVPFDWSADAPVPSGIHAVPRLSLSLYGAKPGALDDHDEPLPPEHVLIPDPSDFGALRTQRIRAPGGTVFLKIDGRGRPGEHCAPSWIRIQSFPGYRTDAIKGIVLWIPTCRATLTDTVTVEKGPFIYGGPGEPRSAHYGETDYTEAERTIELATFVMDRTEVSNAAFAPFGQLANVTGYPEPTYPLEEKYAHDAEPTHPVSSINASEAAAYCAYMGKRLPSNSQWTKAARGGLTILGKQNPSPRRLYPWRGAMDLSCVNLNGSEDGHSWTAPVDVFPCGDSPYGIRQLAGNVQEWTSSEDNADPEKPRYALRGGAADAPPGLDLTTTIFRNHRGPGGAFYSDGLRCVVENPEERP